MFKKSPIKKPDMADKKNKAQLKERDVSNRINNRRIRSRKGLDSIIDKLKLSHIKRMK